jgi:hypothetical protein
MTPPFLFELYWEIRQRRDYDSDGGHGSSDNVAASETVHQGSRAPSPADNAAVGPIWAPTEASEA